MPPIFSLLPILILGAALALTIPFLVSPTSTDNLPPNAFKRFFSRAKRRLEVAQPQVHQRQFPVNTTKMTRTPVYFISHGMPIPKVPQVPL